MKDDKNRAILLVFFLLGFGVGGLTISINASDKGDTATWFSGIAALVAVIFVYLQLKSEREEWNNEHKSSIKVQALVVPAYEKDVDKYVEKKWRNFKIWAVNTKYGSGTYRYVGICKKEDYKLIKDEQFEDPERIFSETNKLINIRDDTKYDTTQRYEIIKGRSVSKTQTVDGEQLCKFLSENENNANPVEVIIIYVDPFNNPQTLDFKLNLGSLKK